MSSISQFLPEPKHTSNQRQPVDAVGESTLVVAHDTSKRNIPGYGERKGWVPKTNDDFGDGGAYPEIQMLQYPLGMGRKRSKKSNALAKQVDGSGNTSYDALVRHNRRSDEVVHSKYKDMIPLRQRADFDDTQDAIPERPDAETVRETTERTKLALEKVMGGRISAGAHKSVGSVAIKEPTYVRYTPNQQGAGFNSGAAQRIVRVSDMPLDPMEPPKIRHQKKARKPASPPAPVMHSPPRKLTADEQKEWSVPPCVSNWKNIHGFTVALDKRLANEGRGMEELSVSDNFARLSEALISAESHARKEISERAQVQQALARKDKEAKEERLRLLAQKAREERAAPRHNPGAVESTGGLEPSGGYEPPPMSRSPSPANDRPPQSPKPSAKPGRMGAADFFDDHARKSRRYSNSRSRSRSPSDGQRERDNMRRERRKEHERSLRLNRMGTDAKAKYLRKTDDRDISEKIALGIAKPTASEGTFDARLFDQPSASNASLQNDEAYNVYDKPLFSAADRMSSNYRPSAAIDEANRASEVDRMMGSDRFGGQLQGLGAAKKSVQPRSGPVEFEKGDVFGIDAFANSARQAKDGKR
ncbi:mRNA splicing protein [Coemansia sp. RSA 1797]|nr:mRNA splicing protein [Coemansia sp. RSA 1797]